jgi:hypothetical protein
MAAKQDNNQPEFERHGKLMVREAPTNPMAHLMLGESYLMAGDQRSAYRCAGSLVHRHAG